jgi:chromosome segregation ATPase
MVQTIVYVVDNAKKNVKLFMNECESFKTKFHQSSNELKSLSEKCKTLEDSMALLQQEKAELDSKYQVTVTNLHTKSVERDEYFKTMIDAVQERDVIKTQAVELSTKLVEQQEISHKYQVCLACRKQRCDSLTP